MELADVLTWLKSLGVPADVGAWTIARADKGGERRVAVWQRPLYDGMQVALGRATLDRVKHVQVLLHWTRDARETEQAAQALYDAVHAADHPTIGDKTASYIDLMLPEPVDLGADESGVLERLLWLDIHYQ